MQRSNLISNRAIGWMIEAGEGGAKAMRRPQQFNTRREKGNAGRNG